VAGISDCPRPFQLTRGAQLTLSDYRDAAGLRGRALHQRYAYTKKFVPRQLPPLERPLRRYGDELLASAAKEACT
jgi:hypothetical protein